MALAVVGGLALVLLAVALVLALVPAGTGGLGARPDPATSYAAAAKRLESLQAREGDVRPICRSRLLSRGTRTKRVVVLFHGLGSCPRQMVELASELRRDGATVLVLRAPEHGLRGDAGRLGGLDAGDFRAYADEAIDIAAGLGDEITVLGFSLGGVLAAWVAENRREVTRAVVVAPAFALGRVPSFVTTGFTNLFSRLPNLELPGSGVSAPYAYPPALPTHPTAAMFVLGKRVLEDAKARAPVAAALAVVINENDRTVSNSETEELVRRWQAHDRSVIVVRFPKAAALPHDIVDVGQPKGRPKVVYPILVALAEGKRPPQLIVKP